MKRTAPYQVNSWQIPNLPVNRRGEATYLNSLMTKGGLSPRESSDAIGFFLQLEQDAETSIKLVIGEDAFFTLDNLETQTV